MKNRHTYIVKTYWDGKPLSKFECYSYEEMRSLKDRLDESNRNHPIFGKRSKVIVSVK